MPVAIRLVLVADGLGATQGGGRADRPCHGLTRRRRKPILKTPSCATGAVPGHHNGFHLCGFAPSIATDLFAPAYPAKRRIQTLPCCRSLRSGCKSVCGIDAGRALHIGRSGQLHDAAGVKAGQHVKGQFGAVVVGFRFCHRPLARADRSRACLSQSLPAACSAGSGPTGLPLQR